MNLQNLGIVCLLLSLTTLESYTKKYIHPKKITECNYSTQQQRDFYDLFLIFILCISLLNVLEPCHRQTSVNFVITEAKFSISVSLDTSKLEI